MRKNMNAVLLMPEFVLHEMLCGAQKIYQLSDK